MTDSIAQALKVLIVGDGLPAWMAASNLAQAVDKNSISIAVLGISNSGAATEPFGYADATLPFGEDILPAGTDESEIIQKSNGSFTHGIAISGWAAPTSTYFHPFGTIGAPLGPVSFLQVALCLRKQNVPVRLANFALAALAAQSGRFVPTSDNPQSVLATCQHGLHLQQSKLADVMKSAAKAKGALEIPGASKSGALNPASLKPAVFKHVEHNRDGSVAAVVADTGERIKADLYIDCSGRSSVLADASRNKDWQDWSAWLPCNQLVSAVIKTTQAPPPYSHSKAFNAGWIQDIPLHNKTVLHGLYSDKYISAGEMQKRLTEYAGSNELQVTFSDTLKFGRRESPWQQNCIALGTANALIDPLAITNLQLLSLGISRLSSLLPSQQNFTAVRIEYNRQMNLLLDHSRDFAAMQYKLNGREGDHFWDDARSMLLPEDLDYKLKLYQSRGLIPLYDEEPLSDTSWVNLFDEHGVSPRQYSTLANGFSQQALQDHLQKIRSVMLEALQKMPPLGDYLTHSTKKTRGF